MEKLQEVESRLSDLETPLLEARNLAMAARMMASADEMPKDSGAALDTIADMLFMKLVEILEEREHQSLLGAEVVVNLAERHVGGRGHLAGRELGIAVLPEDLLGRLEQVNTGPGLFRGSARHHGLSAWGFHIRDSAHGTSGGRPARPARGSDRPRAP